jgi:DNA-binding response OmpR family regulator
MRVLLVEDQPDLAKYTAKALVENGFAVDAVGNLADAQDSSDVASYDVFVLDRKLPDGDSVDWLRAQRQAGVSTPAIVLTASANSIKERVGGLYAGADDYLAKPVSLDEVVARVRALLRRSTGAAEREIAVGNVVLNLMTGSVSIGGEQVVLNRREAGLLEHLMRRTGHVISKQHIEERLYSHGEAVSANAIEVMVHRLRSTLQKWNATAVILTIRGVGYMLRGPGA